MEKNDKNARWKSSLHPLYTSHPLASPTHAHTHTHKHTHTHTHTHTHAHTRNTHKYTHNRTNPPYHDGKYMGYDHLKHVFISSPHNIYSHPESTHTTASMEYFNKIHKIKDPFPTDLDYDFVQKFYFCRPSIRIKFSYRITDSMCVALR